MVIGMIGTEGYCLIELAFRFRHFGLKLDIVFGCETEDLPYEK